LIDEKRGGDKITNEKEVLGDKDSQKNTNSSSQLNIFAENAE
jgi:hypothetical protein